MKNIDVTVIMITYLHEKYIIEAISSVLMQECNFNFELIIADDNSPDNTKNVVLDFLSKSSIKKGIEVRYQKHKRNKGMNENYLWALKNSRGRYVANLEGDDYWISTNKLQRQFDIMESNPLISCCAHNTLTIFEEGIGVNIQSFNSLTFENTRLTKKDFRSINKFHTSSLFMRYSIINSFFDDDILTFRDNPLKIKLLHKGDIIVIPEALSIYRRNNGGVSENIDLDNTYKIEIRTLAALNNEIDGFLFKSLLLKSYWHMNYLINKRDLGMLKKIELFLKFIIPSFYNFPRNLRDIGSIIYNGFIKS